MELNERRSFVLTFKNSSEESLFFWLEPIAFYENIPVGKNIKLTFITNSKDNFDNLFFVEYEKAQVSVWLDYRFQPDVYFQIIVEVDGENIFELTI